MKLSVIIIARDAEATLPRCLASVAWADEIVVVEHGSSDRTAEVARAVGAKVHQSADWPGYGQQKNRALDLAAGEWLFSIDADEWVTGELRAEIERAIAAPEACDAFLLPRRSSFCGRFMRHSGWWPDYVARLFRRGTARFSEDHGHDRLIVTGRRGRLTRPIMHEAIVDLDQAIAKVNVYSTNTARSLHGRGRRAGLATALLHGWWAFTRTYFFRLGFLDGREGFMLAVANGEGSYYRYLKLMLLGEKRPGGSAGGGQ